MFGVGVGLTMTIGAVRINRGGEIPLLFPPISPLPTISYPLQFRPPLGLPALPSPPSPVPFSPVLLPSVFLPSRPGIPATKRFCAFSG